MRTTVTLDPDTAQIVRELMADRGLTFKQAINDAIRASALGDGAPPFQTEAVSMGRSEISLDRALQVAAELEDDELVKRMRAGS